MLREYAVVGSCATAVREELESRFEHRCTTLFRDASIRVEIHGVTIFPAADMMRWIHLEIYHNSKVFAFAALEFDPIIRVGDGYRTEDKEATLILQFEPRHTLN